MNYVFSIIFLGACSREPVVPDAAPVETLPLLGTAGHPEVVRDALGQRWESRGPVAEHEAFLSALRALAHAAGGRIVDVESPTESPDRGDTGSGTEDSAPAEGDEVERTQLCVIVDEAGDEPWLYERVGFDAERVAELVMAYDAAHPNPELLGEVPAVERIAIDRHNVVLGSDDRVAVDIDDYTLGDASDKFVAVRTDGCTQTMFDGTHGLTAAHCWMNGDGDQDVFPPFPIRLPDDSSNPRSVNAVVFNAAYAPGGGLVGLNDWAVFRTANNVSMGDGEFFTLDSTDNDEDVGDTVNNLGNPIDETPAEFVLHGGCEIKDVFQKRLAYDCDTEDGHSGGPTYKFFSDSNVRQIVAVHKGPNSFWNTGARVSFWRSDILAAAGSIP